MSRSGTTGVEKHELNLVLILMHSEESRLAFMQTDNYGKSKNVTPKNIKITPS
jgi:hypothetical protein